MLTSGKRIFRDWKTLRKFGALNNSARDLIVFCDSPGMAVHLDPIIDHLRAVFGVELAYFCTDPSDPRVHRRVDGFNGFCLESSIFQQWFFKSLDARLFLTTTPDLGGGGFPRSVNNVHYAYVHHSMVSTHMIYRPAAFDHFDTVFCCGPHHEKEIRARENSLDLPEKSLPPHGSARLDELLNAVHRKPASAKTRQVLIAPSWGPTGLLETCGVDVVGSLVEAEWDVWWRPHPETLRRTPKVLDELVYRFRDNGRFHYAPDVSSMEAMLTSQIMVSDWSGAALEFALGLERPVIFVDVPRKVNNPEYEALGIEPIEVGLRSKIGKIVGLPDIGDIAAHAADLTSEDWRQRCQEVRHRHIFNPGNSTPAVAQLIAELLGLKGLADDS